MKPFSLPFTRLWAPVIVGVALLAGSAWARPKYKVLHNFGGGHDGGGLFSPPLLDGAGNLYGVTAGGGTGCNGGYGCGTAFELSPSGRRWTETILYNFCTQGGNKCTDGYSPLGPLLFDPAGNLYGATGSGGPLGLGTIFELSPGPSGWSYSVVYDSGSFLGLARSSGGDLYGGGGPGEYKNGDVFELSPGSDGWTYTELYSFTPQESFPESPLIFDKSGNLYGTTYYGGDVFELSPLGNAATGDWTFLTLHHLPSFNGDGISPYAGLAFDASGNLYGATEAGGTLNQSCPDGCGIIFKLAPVGRSKWKETILHRFPDFRGGATPMGTLAFDQSGNLYGTTAGGGGSGNVCFGGCGTVFKMTPSANGKWKYTVLHRFTGADGATPQAGVTVDEKGNVYGTTVQGGSAYAGVVFEITP